MITTTDINELVGITAREKLANRFSELSRSLFRPIVPDHLAVPTNCLEWAAMAGYWDAKGRDDYAMICRHIALKPKPINLLAQAAITVWGEKAPC